MLLFGVAGLCERQLLLETAFMLAFDLMRGAIEWKAQAQSKPFELRILVTYGDGTVFEFGLGPEKPKEIWGPAFDKQVLLSETNDHQDSVLICLETY
jgi:hypothetical protein